MLPRDVNSGLWRGGELWLPPPAVGLVPGDGVGEGGGPGASGRVPAERLAELRTVDRFIDEARMSMRLSHANIVPVFDFGRAGGEYYLAMEWVAPARAYAGPWFPGAECALRACAEAVLLGSGADLRRDPRGEALRRGCPLDAQGEALALERDVLEVAEYESFKRRV